MISSCGNSGTELSFSVGAEATPPICTVAVMSAVVAAA